jgi:hypothetical protein
MALGALLFYSDRRIGHSGEGSGPDAVRPKYIPAPLTQTQLEELIQVLLK